MIFIKVNRCSWTLLYICSVIETYVYNNESRKEVKRSLLCMFCQEKIVVPKKVDKRHKTLNVSSQDFQNVIEVLKKYSDLLSKLYTNLYNAVIQKNKEDLKNENFCYHYQCKRDFNRAIHNAKRSKKRQHDSKKTECEAPAFKKLRPVMETFESNQCHFCERMSDELLHDIRQDSKDLELKIAFRESMSIVIRNL